MSLLSPRRHHRSSSSSLSDDGNHNHKRSSSSSCCCTCSRCLQWTCAFVLILVRLLSSSSGNTSWLPTSLVAFVDNNNNGDSTTKKTSDKEKESFVFVLDRSLYDRTTGGGGGEHEQFLYYGIPGNASDSSNISNGILSDKPPEYFRLLQKRIDEDTDEAERCARYKMTYSNRTTKRKVFYGATISNEPWELHEIIAAESFGIFDGAVFVEGNRTQSFTPRKFARLHHGPTLAKLFGLSPDRVRVRPYINHDPTLVGIDAEVSQRQEVLEGWKELGMQPDDLGLLCDMDEIFFTREFFRALQVCDSPVFDEDKRCSKDYLGFRAAVQIYEGSPECIISSRLGFHPSMTLGHCVEGIGNETIHPRAPRVPPRGLFRQHGYGELGNYDNVKDGRSYPLWNGADFRRIGGLWNHNPDTAKFPNLAPHTGYHFHNFFAAPEELKFKYATYGHAMGMETAMGKTLLDFGVADVEVLARCALNLTDDPIPHKRVRGGYAALDKPNRPVYFEDPDYRRRRQAFLTKLVQDDQQSRSRGGGP